MNRPDAVMRMICAVLFFLGVCSTVAAEGEVTNLPRKIETLIRIRDDGMERLRQVREIRHRLGEKRELYEKEIRRALARAGVVAYEAAMADGRISNNIDLIQRILGHDGQLGAYGAQLEELLGEVEFVLKEAEDAFRVQKTLSVANLPDLMGRIERSVSVHRSVTGRRLLPAGETPVVDRKKIWQMVTENSENAPKRPAR